jgi:DNA-binding response OmpR family regulator
MPGGSGIDLCKKLREVDSTTPILFYSGAVYDSDKQEAFASGAQGYLTKPVQNDQLVREVFNLISNAKTETLPPHSSPHTSALDEGFDYQVQE